MSCICSFPWAGMCVECSERTARFAADFINGVCSSECTKECSANDHCDRRSNPYCECKNCKTPNNQYIIDAVKGEPNSLTSIAFHTGEIMERERIIKLILQQAAEWTRPLSHNPVRMLQALADKIRTDTNG